MATRYFSATFVLNGASNPMFLYPVDAESAGFARVERISAGKYEFELAEVWPQTFHPFFGGPVDAVLGFGATFGSGSEAEALHEQTTLIRSATTGRLVMTVRLKDGEANADPVGLASLAVFIEVDTAPNE